MFAVSIPGAEAKDACRSDELSRSLNQERAAELIQQQLTPLQFDCAIEMAHARAIAIAAMPGEDGFEARFALRELAVDVSSRAQLPADSRVAFLKASVFTRQPGSTADVDEIGGDLSMLAAAVTAFLDQGEQVAAFDAIDLAIRLELQAPAARRSLREWNVSFGFPTLIKKRLPQLIALADAVRDAPSLSFFRQDLVRSVYRTHSVYDPNESAEVVAARAAGLLQLVGKLRDVQRFADVVPGWYWQPIMHAGVAQILIGRTEEGREHVESALRILHDMENPDYRLNQSGFALSLLLNMHRDGKGRIVHYDRDRLLSVMDEVQTLADSVDTPIAKETRARIPPLRARLLAESEQ